MRCPSTAAALLVLVLLSACRPPLRPVTWPQAGLESAGRQRLYRVSVRFGPDSFRFRLALRMEPSGDFDLVAIDTLGRRSWSVRRWGKRALWIDHREKTACETRTSAWIWSKLPLPLPLESMPRVLDGLPPFPPASPAEETEAGFSYRDELGREWEVRLGPAEGIVGWSGLDLARRQLRFRAEAEEMVLEVPKEQLVVRWRRVADELLAEPLPEPIPPDGYREVGCSESR